LNAAPQKLLIISRDALLDAIRGPVDPAADTSDEGLFRSLANISRHGYHLLLTAPEPDRWVPTRGNVDDALNSQNMLIERVQSAGGEIDGVYYVPRSLLTQDRNREGALVDILQRYALNPDAATLVSSSAPFLKAAERLRLTAIEVTPPGKRGKKLAAVLKAFPAAG
jgi:hypothetical protein